MNQDNANFSGWAKVEVLGRNQHIGFTVTEAYGAAVLFRIDVPPLPEREFILEEPSYVEHETRTIWMHAGAKVLRQATEGHTVLVGAGSIYRIIPCTEAAAMRAIELETRSKLKLIEAPPEKAIAAPIETSTEEQEANLEGNRGVDFDDPDDEFYP